MNLNDIKIPSLAERAILVRLKRSMFQPYAYDSVQTTKIEAESGVLKAGRFNKRLFLDCYEVKDTNAAFNDVYKYVQRSTTPWLDDGVRMLPSAMYFDFTAGVRELIAVAKRKVDNLAPKWDTLVAQDLARLKHLGDPKDYPTDIRARYDIGLKFLPVPTVNDFRVEISDDDRASLDSAIREAEEGITKYLVSELLQPIKKAAEKLAVPIGHDGSFFHDSLFNNITEMVERAKKLNIMDDPTVSALVTDIERNVGKYALAPDLVREDIGARNTAQSELEAIMSKMAGLF
jgi:hypothetical protein